jgi:hypothetical protein
MLLYLRTQRENAFRKILTRCLECIIIQVIHKSLRDFQPLRYSSRDGHAEGKHVNRGRDLSNFFFCVLGAMAYLQVSPLGECSDEIWHGQGIRKRSVLEFAKTESIVSVQRRFQTTHHTEPPMDKTICEWYMKFQ